MRSQRRSCASGHEIRVVRSNRFRARAAAGAFFFFCAALRSGARARAGAMTPEHVSELQNILRFLRANAFEKSEAALVDEVEALMRAAQLEKDDAERRLEASASGNNDEADASLNREDPGSAREVSNDTFGPASPPAVPRPSLGRFGSDVERAHAAMALEDAFENEAAGKEAHADPSSRRLIHLDEDAESVGTLDTFATPIGDDDGDDASASISSRVRGESISASEFANHGGGADAERGASSRKKTKPPARRDDDLGERVRRRRRRGVLRDDADDASSARRLERMRTCRTTRTTTTTARARLFFQRVSAEVVGRARVEKTEACGVANGEDVEDSEDSEAFDRRRARWRPRPCGRSTRTHRGSGVTARARVPRGDRRRTRCEDARLRGTRAAGSRAGGGERHRRSNASLGESRNDRLTGASSSEGDPGPLGGGRSSRAGRVRVPDRSPAGSERSGPPRARPADGSKTDCPYTMDPRMGWGGSEFGGDSEPSRNAVAARRAGRRRRDVARASRKTDAPRERFRRRRTMTSGIGVRDVLA